jgi:rhodanese-related sulfurtransferase/DNA-binding transcriptional ArsR family regulator
MGPKQAIFESLAQVASALSHAHRLELLERIAQGPRSVEDLASTTKLSVANTSRHLQLLRRARLVDTERQGKHIFYRLAGAGEVVELLKALGRVGESNMAEVQCVMHDYFEDRDALEAVSRKELLSRLKEGSVTLLDVRPKDEYALGHLPGALNVPMNELERRLDELPKRREIVAYCRGPYCVMSFEAVAALRAKGYKVRRLEDGFPEWKASGLRIEVGA